MNYHKRNHCTLSITNIFYTLMLILSSINCHGLNNSLADVKYLCKESQICFLQEHWLRPDQLDTLKAINTGFYGEGESAVDTGQEIKVGRPYGGVGCLWRKELNSRIQVRKYNDPRIMALQLDTGDGTSLLIINVYLPYECPDNHEDYTFYLGMIYSIIQDATTSRVMVIGDWNAHFGRPFGQLMAEFCRDNGLTVSDWSILDDDTYTFVNAATGSTSWIDHCVSTTGAHDLITGMEVRYDLVTSDHRAVMISLDVTLSVQEPVDNNKPEIHRRILHWDQQDKASLDAYERTTAQLLSAIEVPAHLCQCSGCTDPIHTHQLEIYYEAITQALRQAAAIELQWTEAGNGKNEFNVPGWNTAVSELYQESREAFLWWRYNNSPKHGYIFDSMKVARARFKLVFRECRSAEDTYRANAIAASLDTGDYQDFWNKIRQSNACKTSLPQSIGGANGTDEIADMWRQHYSGLFNSVNNESCKDSVMQKLEHINNDFTLSVDDVSDSLKTMKRNKSSLADDISSEHLLHAHKSICVHLSLLLNSMFTHSYIPSQMMKVVLIPLVKNKNGDITDNRNYRPIAIATATSKILERCILTKCDTVLQSGDNQFGFKSGHSTDNCIFVIKETVRHFLDRDTPVFSAFLDASKAFDLVNHWTLLDKLCKRGVPLSVVKLILFWYRHQTFTIFWDGTYSSSFTVGNGVRQGSILSPILFNVYTDDLSKRLNNVDHGLSTCGSIKNHNLYADDISLFAPTQSGLQALLDVCTEYGLEHDITFNPVKSVCLAFLPKWFPNSSLCDPSLSSYNLKFVEKVTYLGHIICSDLSDDDDILSQKRKLCVRANMLIRKFSKCSESVKITLFRSYITPIYCTSLWQKYRKSSMDSLKSTYNRAFRQVFKLPTICSISENFVRRRIPSFQELIRKSINNLIFRLKASVNVHICGMVTAKAMQLSTYAKHWDSVLLLRR